MRRLNEAFPDEKPAEAAREALRRYLFLHEEAAKFSADGDVEEFTRSMPILLRFWDSTTNRGKS